MGIHSTARCEDHFCQNDDAAGSPWFTSFARREERKKYPGTRKLKATSKRGKPYQLFKAWSQEVGDAARQAMIAARNAELAAGQAKRYKYFAKSARDAAQNASASEPTG
ncbi:hif1an [Symbiodinium microadriaticum]|nr:hif1an [Symbiodinium microadriaticum]